MTYQIELNHGKKSKSWLYFSCSHSDLQSVVEGMVRKEFNLDFKRYIQLYDGTKYKVNRNVIVREYDTVRKKPVRGSIKFKLSC